MVIVFYVLIQYQLASRFALARNQKLLTDGAGVIFFRLRPFSAKTPLISTWAWALPITLWALRDGTGLHDLDISHRYFIIFWVVATINMIRFKKLGIAY